MPQLSSSSLSAQVPSPNNVASPALEQTLSTLSSHRSVLGYMLISRGHHPSIIRHSGVVFEGEQGKRYAAAVARIVESVQTGLEEVRADDGLAAATGDAEGVSIIGCTVVCRSKFPLLPGWNPIHENKDKEAWDYDLTWYVFLPLLEEVRWGFAQMIDTFWSFSTILQLLELCIFILPFILYFILWNHPC